MRTRRFGIVETSARLFLKSAEYGYRSPDGLCTRRVCPVATLVLYFYPTWDVIEHFSKSIHLLWIPQMSRAVNERLGKRTMVIIRISEVLVLCGGAWLVVQELRR